MTVTTERLYYTDCYLREFTAQTAGVEENGTRVYLDRTAFYPASGGQLHDLGTINGIAVADVIDEGERIAHITAAPIGEGSISGSIDWPRRLAFMRQHTGQHLLSAIAERLYGFRTVSVHLGEEGATIELAAPQVSDVQLQQLEREANAAVWAGIPVTIGFENAASVEGLRKASGREGDLRIVTIGDLDKSACGGTHVRSTTEIGLLLLRGTEKIRGNTRLAFVTGECALARARADFDALSAAGRTLSKAIDEVPASVAAMQEAARESAKQVKKLSIALGAAEGRRLYSEASTINGLKAHWLKAEGALDDSARAIAQSFTSTGPAVFLATGEGSLLLATSPDAGLHCGNRLKELVAPLGGRGGGAAQLAQGSIPDASRIQELAAALGFPVA